MKGDSLLHRVFTFWLLNRPFGDLTAPGIAKKLTFVNGRLTFWYSTEYEFINYEA